MRKRALTMANRAVQAAIGATVTWATARAFDLPWLIYGVIALVGYGLFCLGYAVVLWCARKR